MTIEQLQNNIEGLKNLEAVDGLELFKKYINDVLLPALEELKYYKESSLRPAVKYLSADIDEQIEHLQSEFKEMINEKGKNNENMAMEVVDIQMSCETLLAIMGYSQIERMDLRKEVIRKNENRGYY